MEEYVGPEEKVTKINGEPNAFSIEIAASDVMFVDSFRLLLDGAFECYPNDEYCLLSCPPKTIHPDLRQYFVKATPKPNSNFPHDLFVLHRASLKCGSMNVTPIKYEDIKELEGFTSNLINRENLINYLENVLDDHDDDDESVKVYAFQIQHVLIGLAVIRPMDIWRQINEEYLFYEFDELEYCRNEDDIGIMEYFIISPIFLHHARLFMREIFRMADYKAIFYILNQFEFDTEELRRSYCCLIGK